MPTRTKPLPKHAPASNPPKPIHALLVDPPALSRLREEFLDVKALMNFRHFLNKSGQGNIASGYYDHIVFISYCLEDIAKGINPESAKAQLSDFLQNQFITYRNYLMNNLEAYNQLELKKHTQDKKHVPRILDAEIIGEHFIHLKSSGALLQKVCMELKMAGSLQPLDLAYVKELFIMAYNLIYGHLADYDRREAQLREKLTGL